MCRARLLALQVLTAVRNGHATPHAQNREMLMRASGDFAREQLRRAGQPVLCGDLETSASCLAPSLSTLFAMVT
jgi:hypothetical protein